MVFEDGSFYEGGFLDNMFEGYGLMSYKDGSTYEGSWGLGKKHGKGLLKVRSEAHGQHFDMIGVWKAGEIVEAQLPKIMNKLLE